MKDIVNIYADRFRHGKQLRLRLTVVLILMAVAVSGSVFWQLHYTGTALANETYCGYEEHCHTETCYKQVLICGMDENEGAAVCHTHDESCYETVKTLECGHNEMEGHTHTEECYEVKETLLCELSEDEGHVHDKECCVEEKFLVCELDEQEGHIHQDSCYTEEQVLVCELEEDEAEEHIHDESCYEAILDCEKPEHTHSIDCMIDETADVETAKEWEADLPQLTGVWADDVVAVAQSQIGYTESEKNFRYDGETNTCKGYTRYGAWYGNPYGDWCAMFVSFCLNYAEVPNSAFPEAAGVYAWIAELKKAEAEDEPGERHLYADAGDYSPSPGDIIFFDIEQDQKADHVGIVKEVKTRTDLESGEEKVVEIEVIEGNCNNAVCETTYKPDDKIIAGYGILPENPENENHGSDETEPDEETAEREELAESLYEAEDGGVTVNVIVPEGALPAGAELRVTLYEEEDDEYASALALLDEAAETSVITDSDETDCSFVITLGGACEDDTEDEDQNEDAGAEAGYSMALLDISFILDGETVEPAEPANVIIDASGLLENIDDGIASLNVWHLKETGEGSEPVLVAEVYGAEEAENGVAEFTVDSFSDFAVQWYPDYKGDKKHYGQIYVNLFDAETNDRIQGRTADMSYDSMEHESIELAAGSDFINEMGTDRTEYLFSYATVTANDGGDNSSSAENPVKYVVLTYSEADTYTWKYTFYDSDDEILYSYEEEGRHGAGNGNLEPELNLYFTKEPYVITWSEKAGQSYVSFETRNAETNELLGGSFSWEKQGVGTAIAMSDNGLLEKVHPGSEYSYFYATVYDPETGKLYGTENASVTAVWATVTSDAAAGGSIWTYSIRSGDDVLSTVTKTYDPDDKPYTGRDLLITLYYIDYTREACVALDSRNGDINLGGRDYIRGLDRYADESGEITITLPDNDHLGENFAVYTDSETGGKIYVNASEVTRNGIHEWRVAGWFNIATGQYFDVSSGPAQATINIKENINVFYADLVSGTYDNAFAGNSSLVESESTNEFVTVQLFDYNELFNLYSSYLRQESIEKETWDAGYPNIGASLYSEPVLTNIEKLNNEGKRITRSFLFQDTSCGNKNLGCPDNLNYWNTYTGFLSGTDLNGEPCIDNVLTAKNWDITDPGSRLLNMLFDTTGSIYGVHYIGNADGLFQYGDEDAENLTGADGQTYNFNGYYYYSSNLNAAVYNQSEGRFYLYDSPQKAGWNSAYNMFLPFNSYNPNGAASQEIDYWFGMKMEVDFYLPGATGEKYDDESFVNTIEQNNMRFNFSGDDDIMVFVDNTLILDMAGIHDEADGYIDFAEGRYYYRCLNQTGGDVTAKPFEGSLYLSSGTHKLTVFYMERGAGASNLTVSFNVVPSWKYYSEGTAAVRVKKEWDDGDDLHVKDYVTMGLFEEAHDGNCEYVITKTDEGTSFSGTFDGKTFSCTFDGDSAYGRDSEGKIIAYLEDDTLFILLDETPIGVSGTQVLNADNEWTFIWELLDEESSYRVIELYGPENYMAVSTSSEFGSWEYWNIIGERELEEMYQDSQRPYLILTDAANNSDASVKYPQGYLIRNNLTTAGVILSAAPKWGESASNGLYAWFGQIADSQIRALENADPAVYVRFEAVFTGKELQDDEYVDSVKVHAFYLKPEYRNVRYLKLNSSKDGLDYTESVSEAAAFYVDSHGQLRIDGEHKRVVIEEGILKVAESSDNVEYGKNNINIRVYTLSEVPVSGTEFNFINTAVAKLPDTGGPGTWLYILTGLMFALLAVFLFCFKERGVVKK